MFLKTSVMESTNIFNMKNGCNVFCAKIIAWLTVVKESTNTLNFYISECGVDCSAEPGAK